MWENEKLQTVDGNITSTNMLMNNWLIFSEVKDGHAYSPQFPLLFYTFQYKCLKIYMQLKITTCDNYSKKLKKKTTKDASIGK